MISETGKAAHSELSQRCRKVMTVMQQELESPVKTNLRDSVELFNFVLKQSGARARAARSDVPLIDQQSLRSRFRQMNGHQRPGDPAADNDRVTRNIAL